MPRINEIVFDDQTFLKETNLPPSLPEPEQPIGDGESEDIQPGQIYDQIPVDTEGVSDMLPFDPEGLGYDYNTATQVGGMQDSNGHWASRDPNTGMILKGMQHPTIDKTIQDEEFIGNIVSKGEDGRYYSNPPRKEDLDTTIVDTGIKNYLGHNIKVAKDVVEPLARVTEELNIAGISLQLADTYRSQDVQAQMYQASKGTPKEGLVAPPGKSDHEHGLAIDLAQIDTMKNDQVFDTLKKHGFHPIADEWWHWYYGPEDPKAMMPRSERAKTQSDPLVKQQWMRKKMELARGKVDRFPLDAEKLLNAEIEAPGSTEEVFDEITNTYIGIDQPSGQIIDPAQEELELNVKDIIREQNYKNYLISQGKYKEAFAQDTENLALAEKYQDGDWKQGIIGNMFYKFADAVSAGTSKGILTKPAYTQLMENYRRDVGYSEEDLMGKIWRTAYAAGEGTGHAIGYMGPSKLFGYTRWNKWIKSALTFGSVGGVRRAGDPEELEHMSLRKWVIGTGLDATLGAFFPFLGSAGGSVVAEPSTTMALAKFMLQTGAITGGMTVTQLAEMFNAEMEDNPDQPAMESFVKAWDQVTDPETLIKSLSMMAFLHGTSTGQRFMKDGKVNAQQHANLVKQAQLYFKDMPFNLKKRPTTPEQAKEYFEAWDNWALSEGNRAEYFRQTTLKDQRKERSNQISKNEPRLDWKRDLARWQNEQIRVRKKDQRTVIEEEGVEEGVTKENMVRPKEPVEYDLRKENPELMKEVNIKDINDLLKQGYTEMQIGQMTKNEIYQRLSKSKKTKEVVKEKKDIKVEEKVKVEEKEKPTEDISEHTQRGLDQAKIQNLKQLGDNIKAGKYKENTPLYQEIYNKRLAKETTGMSGIQAEEKVKPVKVEPKKEPVKTDKVDTGLADNAITELADGLKSGIDSKINHYTKSLKDNIKTYGEPVREMIRNSDLPEDVKTKLLGKEKPVVKEESTKLTEEQENVVEKAKLVNKAEPGTQIDQMAQDQLKHTDVVSTFKALNIPVENLSGKTKADYFNAIIKHVKDAKETKTKPTEGYAPLAGESVTTKNVFRGKHKTITVNPEDLTINHRDTKASASWLGQMQEKGYVEQVEVKEGFRARYKLTEAGEKVYKQGQANVKAMLEGVPADKYEPKKINKKPTNDKVDDVGTIYTGKIDGQPAWSEGHMILLGKPGKGDLVSTNKPNLQNVVANKKGDVAETDLRLIGATQAEPGLARHVWLSDGKTLHELNADYFDYINSVVENPTYRASTGSKAELKAVHIYENGKWKGMLMPVRYTDIPSNISKLSGMTESGPKSTSGESMRAYGGGSTTGESTSSVKDNFKTADLDNPITKRKIGEELARDLDQEPGKGTRFGLIERWKKRSRVLGIFWPHSTIIRVRNISDVKVLSHELGHKLDDVVFGFSDKMKYDKLDKADIKVTMANGLKDVKKREHRLNQLRSEYGEETVKNLLDRAELRAELKKFLVDRGYPEVNTAEGIAEMISDYVVSPTGLAEKLPKFHKLFEETIGTTPKIKDALLHARKQWEEWHAQDPRVKTESTIAREKNTFMNGILRKTEGAKEKLYYNILDNTALYKKIEKELTKKTGKISGENSPYRRFLSMLGIEGKAEQFLHNAPFMIKGENIKLRKDVKPFLKIIKPYVVNGELKVLEGYITAKRNVSLYEASKKTKDPRYKGSMTTSIDLARKTMEGHRKNRPDLDQAAKEIHKYNDALLDYYVDSGMLSNSDATLFRSYHDFYIPFRRYFAQYEYQNAFQGKFDMGKFMKEHATPKVKAIQKGEKFREIIPPVEQELKQTYDLIRASDMNRTKLTVIDALQAIDKQLVQLIPKSVIKGVPDFDGIVHYSRKTEKPGGAILTVRRNGEIEFYEVPKEYHENLMAVNADVHAAIKVLALPSRILRKGAVDYNPVFGIRNIFRDQGSAIMYSRHGYAPWDFLKGFKSLVTNDVWHQKFLASGASQSFLVGMDKHLQFSKKKGMYTNVGDMTLKGKIKKYANPFNIVKDMNQATEMGTRIGAFQKAYRKTGGDVWQAMEEARHVSADYGVKGAMMQPVGALYPFLNARMAHFRNFGEAVKNRPGKVLLRGLMFSTAPAVANWFWNNRNEESRQLYQELPTWRRNSFYNMQLGDSKYHFMVPKGPFGYAFGTGVETFLDWMYDSEPASLLEFAHGMVKETSPIGGGGGMTELLPQFGRPIHEYLANKDAFTGRPIVPKNLEGGSKFMQYDETTNQLMVKIGEKLDISPKLWQHVIESSTAGTGKTVLSITDDLAELMGIVDKRPEKWKDLLEYPMSRAFMARPYIGSRGESMQKVWETLDEIEKVNTDYGLFMEREFQESDPDKKLKIKADYAEYDEENKDTYNWFIQQLPEAGGSTNGQQMHKFMEVVKYLRIANERLLEGKISTTIKGEKMLRDMSDSEVNSLTEEYKLLTPTHLVNQNHMYITEQARILLEKFENKEPFILSKELNNYHLGQSIKQDMQLSLIKKGFKKQRQMELNK